jgi:hypothetical protein
MVAWLGLGGKPDHNTAQNRQQDAPAQATPRKQFFDVKQIPLTEKQLLGVYLGRVAVVKAQIARIKANKKISADARKEELTSKEDQLRFSFPQFDIEATSICSPNPTIATG